VRIDAALAYQSQPREAFQQRRGNRRSFANQDQRFSLVKSIGEEIEIINLIVPDRDVVAIELAKALERANTGHEDRYRADRCVDGHPPCEDAARQRLFQSWNAPIANCSKSGGRIGATSRTLKAATPRAGQ
jgi:hypothetical protein